ncbi:hypothetical protein PFISCL1PPCAC_19088 [Pristionchus fissidentatus]|uniref:CUB-like domain-containing protein n=1 Tax=Pristionchus fissidentatus TaxID=1538716 RepID=A0AAV5W7H5_9BILA|nr:hypothetical protein PFISCL1PPCAC_19088 [Pristionchus fissidentatus]
MISLYSPMVAFIALLSTINAKVEFTYSTMYDIFDFQNVDEVPLPRCNDGCLIFAPTLGVHPENEDLVDTYMKNLVVYDGTVPMKSVGEIARQFEDITTKKIPFDMPGKKTYKIVNLNYKKAKSSDVTVWIIDTTKANDFDYEIYDPAYMNRAVSVPKSLITIMSAARFFVKAEKGQSVSFTARLVGFDNAQEKNEDQCDYAYKTGAAKTFDGFEFHVNAPIISLAFTEKNPINIKADFMYLNTRNLTKSAFITTPGYNGCRRLGNGQVYHSLTYGTGDEFELHSEPDFTTVAFDVDLDLPEGNKIQFKDMTNSATMPLMAAAPSNAKFNFTDTQFVIVYYDNLKPLESFMIRYTSTPGAKQPANTLPSSSPTSFTSTTITPTTSETSHISGVPTLISIALLTILR